VPADSPTNGCAVVCSSGWCPFNPLHSETVIPAYGWVMLLGSLQLLPPPVAGCGQLTREQVPGLWQQLLTSVSLSSSQEGSAW
jgi:hypothetical protein